MTETHVAGAYSYVSEEGFLLVFSGGPVGSTEYAGVGMIVAFWARRYVIGFSEFSDRIISMKVRVKAANWELYVLTLFKEDVILRSAIRSTKRLVIIMRLLSAMDREL